MKSPLNDQSREELIKLIHENEKKLNQLNEQLQFVEEENVRYKELFDNSRTPMWEEDITELILYLKNLKKDNVDSFQKYFNENPEELENCIKKIKIINVNQATVQLHNAQSKEHLISNLEKVFTPISLEAFKEEIISIANGNLEYECETNAKTFNGSLIDLRLYLKISDRIKENELKYFALISTIDITKQKNAESKLENSEKSLREILDASDDVAILIDSEGFILEVNKACQKLFGSKRLDIIGRKLDHFASKEILESRRVAIRKSVKTKSIVFHQDFAFGKRWESSITPLLDPNKNVEKLVIFQKDVTERLRAKQKLEDSENKYRSIFDNINISLTHVNRFGEITDINQFHIDRIGQVNYLKLITLGQIF
jgi:PAS domain S-box-containing protein